jgi:hypothetical protein
MPCVTLLLLTPLQIKSCAESIVADGGVEACVCALRANANKMGIVTSACTALLRLCDTTDGSLAVARQGGTRQIIQTVQANAGMPGVSDAMAIMMSVLQRVSVTTEGSQVLANQGGVDAVMQLADATTTIEGCPEMSTKILARLLSSKDVEAIINELNDVAVAVSSTLQLWCGGTGVVAGPDYGFVRLCVTCDPQVAPCRPWTS